VAENQRLAVEALASQGAIAYLGESRQVTADRIATSLKEFMGNFALLSRLSEASGKLVDGKGLERVAARVFRKKARILFLGPADSPVMKFLIQAGEDVLQTVDRIDAAFAQASSCEFLVSYGYRHILKPEVLELFPNKAVNLHISLLPWNRGADPNFWSFVEDTPKGVTIHFLDEGVDTGDIIAQEEVSMESHDTLTSSYERLHQAITELFRQNWLDIRAGRSKRFQQKGGGTVHRSRDKEGLLGLLEPDGWNTPVRKLVAKKDRS
jgi:methionyl-tRNA formyltransferase